MLTKITAQLQVPSSGLQPTLPPDERNNYHKTGESGWNFLNIERFEIFRREILLVESWLRGFHRNLGRLAKTLHHFLLKLLCFS